MPDPSHSSAADLLAALEALPYARRMQALAAHVRGLAPAGALRSLLDGLEAQGAYGRGLAVVAASVGGDHAWIAQRLADPDSFVRAHAHSAALHGRVSDEAFEAALDGAPQVVRRQLFRTIAAQGRSDLADRLIDRVRRDWGDVEAARLLRACSPTVVGRLLPELSHAVRAWASLAGHHPDAVLDEVERELAALPSTMYSTRWPQYAPAVAAVAGIRPLRVLRLLERFTPEHLPSALRRHMSLLAAADPAAMLRLLLGPMGPDLLHGRLFTPGALRSLLESGAPEVPAYTKALAEAGELPRALRALPPGRREACYRQAIAGRGRSGFPVDSALLSALPRSCVADEARRMADLAREQGLDWHMVLEAESFLPVAEVRERLVEATRRAAAEDRAHAWKLLVRNAARSGDPAAVSAVLQDITRLRNEQDPVRSAALQSLALTRPALFSAQDAPHLDRVVDDAVEARDCSQTTRSALNRLALSVLREQPEGGCPELTDWALSVLVRVSGTTGGADLGRLDQRLRRGQEHQVYEALRPSIEAAADKADFGPVLALARSLGRRAYAMPGLQDMLWRAIRTGSDTTARHAIELWLADSVTRDERTERLIALDPSAAVLPAVSEVLARRRTDLLDHVLGEEPPYGRFLVKGSLWTVAVDPWAKRWTPGQHAAAARQLARTVENAGLPKSARVAALVQSAHLPDLGAPCVRRWTDARDVVVAEAALAALARTDRPAEALPELLAHTGTERARVAVFAAARVTRDIAPVPLIRLLREVLLSPDAKVTSRKEAARLAADRLPVSAAAGLLVEAYGQDGAHRDVRAACVSVAGGLLGDERIWELLADAARAEPGLQGGVLRVTPEQLAEPHRARYARLVRDVSRTPDPETAALAFLALGRWAPWHPEAADVLARAVSDLSVRQGWTSAAAGLVRAARHPASATGLAQAMARLVRADRNPDAADAEEQRDRPARQRIDYLVRQLHNATLEGAATIRPAALAAGELLAEHPEFRREALKILAGHLDLDTGEPELTAALLRLAALHEDRPVLTVQTADCLQGRVAYHGVKDEAAPLATADRLARHGGHAEGMIATALVAGVGRRTGWPAHCRDALRTLRRHPAADVRDAALGHLTAQE
ncbi:hypothetical protein H9Y04_10870 [Streptomyces sp. TRM66268-LWL]|uniref:HEAT repeat domain-containing protein n=1 Tax=Streptomyces polyasparticus TaxID=2767826 RepID=A0ABR7SC65_9ACTN|nr:hypothetical protein [Streptomyces polyasparticus]MBC9713071.1 hypothetical protein [Streptomyces polyasparticus]